MTVVGVGVGVVVVTSNRIDQDHDVSIHSHNKSSPVSSAATIAPFTMIRPLLTTKHHHYTCCLLHHLRTYNQYTNIDYIYKHRNTDVTWLLSHIFQYSSCKVSFSDMFCLVVCGVVASVLLVRY